jgi:ATP-dependent Clp protease ATP-binding subunit ClpB
MNDPSTTSTVEEPWSFNESPPWVIEMQTCIASSQQFVFCGNVHDEYLLAGPTRAMKFASLRDLVERVLRDLGFDYVVCWDPVLELRENGAERAETAEQISVQGTTTRPEQRRALATHSVDELRSLMKKVIEDKDRLGCLIVTNSSRIDPTFALSQSQPDRLSPGVGMLFREALSFSHNAPLLRKQLGNRIAWIVDSERELPPWFLAEDSGIRVLNVGLPNPAERTYAAYRFYLRSDPPDSEDTLRQAALVMGQRTHGQRLRELNEIAQLAALREIQITDIDQAIRAHRVGVVRNPWASPQLRAAIASAETLITDSAVPFDGHVFGQEQAVHHTVNILMRSASGLSSAHAQGEQNGPRGVLFFAGPTGVGKTQLAKAINKIVFDSEEPIRFDMSEFASEHSEARLLGAPPGYVGHGPGGELTNAIRKNPFSVVLFDEIEKAHSSILDKFLQILSDGRLTDGNGRTVYFTESIIIFTSNWGMHYMEGEVRRPVERNGSFAEFADTVRRNIQNGFEQLARPEILNRIGIDNIVVFDFIQKVHARQIFEGNVRSVQERVSATMGVDVELASAALERIWDFAWERCNTERMGGRGIGTAVETALVNPLARYLFERPSTTSFIATILDAHREEGGRWHLEVQS